MARQPQRVAATRSSAKQALTPELVEGYRRDFLTLMKNIPVVTRSNILEFREGIKTWVGDPFDGLGFTGALKSLRIALEESGRNHLLYLLDPAFVFGSIFGSVPISTRKGELSRYPDRDPLEAIWQLWVRDSTQWVAKVKRLAPAVWKNLKQIADSVATPLLVQGLAPDTQLHSMSGFRVQLRGLDHEDTRYLGSIEEAFSRLQKQLQIFPWALRNAPPFIVHLGAASKNAATYGAGVINVYYWGYAAFSRKEIPKLVHTLAHELGHHYYQQYLSQQQRDAWVAVVREDVTQLDLRDVFGQMQSGETIWNLGDRIQKSDPVLHMQLGSLAYSPWYTQSGLETLQDIQEWLQAGHSPIVNVPLHPVTGYGAKNPEEAFCEVVGLLVAHGPKAVSPTVLRWFNTVLGGHLRVTAATVERLARRVVAEKSQAEKEDAEAGRLVRPSSKDKPPRTDRRRERTTVPDADLEQKDPDMSLNRKDVGG